METFSEPYNDYFILCALFLYIVYLQFINGKTGIGSPWTGPKPHPFANLPLQSSAAPNNH
jgi:hypothetical protein